MRLKVSNVCQLLDKSNYEVTSTKVGITWTNNGDGTVIANGNVVSGTIYSAYRISLPQFREVKNNHKYALFSGINNINVAYVECIVHLVKKNGSYFYQNCVETNIAGTFGFTIPQGEYPLLQCVELRVRADYTANNLVFKPQLFDLTEMYGAGNEPTTVEQFRQDFPNEMYEYSPVCWKKFRRLKYIANKQPVQLLDKSTYKNAIHNGITYTPNIDDGTWTITGTGTDLSFCSLQSLRVGVDFEVGDKVLLRNSSRNDTTYFPFAPYYGSNNKYLGEKDGEGIFTILNNTVRIHVQLTTRVTGVALNITTQVQVFNLTRMYGKGNEPTAAEFFAQYPGFDYPVNKYNYLTLNRGKYIVNKEPVQLLDKSKFYKTSVDYGVTWTNNGDGTITANGTATNIATYTLLVPNPRVIPGHKYLFISSITPQQADVATIITNIGGESGNGFIFTTDLTHINIYFYVRTNVTVSNVVFKPQLFDLTAMYGEGNEPTTVAQFKADYPNELYDYNPYNAITFR